MEFGVCCPHSLCVLFHNSKIEQALKYDVPIFKEEWILDTQKEKKKLDLTKYLIGGSEYAQKQLKYVYTDPATADKPVEEKERKVKLVMKGW